MAEYTPTIEDLARAAYCTYLEGTSRTREESAAEFDAWLAEVRAGVVTEEPEWEREIALHWVEADTYTDRGADEADMRAVVRATQHAAEIVERRVAPWVPVEQGDET